jgi:hypothetical protein
VTTKRKKGRGMVRRDAQAWRAFVG